jgi:hypothetical protein
MIASFSSFIMNRPLVGSVCDTIVCPAGHVSGSIVDVAATVVVDTVGDVVGISGVFEIVGSEEVVEIGGVSVFKVDTFGISVVVVGSVVTNNDVKVESLIMKYAINSQIT